MYWWAAVAQEAALRFAVFEIIHLISRKTSFANTLRGYGSEEVDVLCSQRLHTLPMIQVAPAIGKVLSEMAAGQTPSVDVSFFSFDRFLSK